MIRANLAKALSWTVPLATVQAGVSTTIFADDGMFHGHREHYFSCGASALNVIGAAVALSEIAEVRSILDFGSGAGRVTRWLRAAYPAAQLGATDIRPADLAFCASEFGAETWESGIIIDALSAPRSYDLIWVGSVLTHLPEELSVRLVRKLLSFLAPDGLLVASIHGRFAQSNASRAHNYGVAERWAEVEQGFFSTGYGYVDYPQQTDYGISLAKPSWVARFVEQDPQIRLVLLSERAWDGHHDVVAIQNTPAALNAAW